MTPAIDRLRASYLDAVRARLDADAAVVAAAIEHRRAEREGDLMGAADDAWNAARRRRMAAEIAEQSAHSAYAHELYAATYGHEGRP